MIEAKKELIEDEEDEEKEAVTYTAADRRLLQVGTSVYTLL